MSRPPPRFRPAGFTFVELLLALALGALVAAILGTLVHGLLAAGEGQSDRLRGPFAARAALRGLARELACAFAPPVENLPPLRLAASTEVGRPETALSFYVPVPGPLGYDVEQVTYEIAPTRGPRREWRRISVPCSGPHTNAPVTNVLYEGRFALTVEVLVDGAAQAVWPPPENDPPAGLPASVRLTLAVPGQEPRQTEVLIQAATGIRCPVERDEPDGNSATNAPAGE
jgi:prepilin-type N-terminal cleavage/methylation domain-containing protein